VAFYEWWCPRCRVTYPPGRKQCVHCGGRVQTSRDAPTVFDPRAGAGLPGAPDEPAEEAGAPEPRAARAARIGLTLVWVALAVLASVLRACQERQ